MSGFSGLCAACGKRVESALPCIYVPSSGAFRYLYILCDRCRAAIEDDLPEKEDVLLAVELRVQHGPASQ